MPGLPAEWEHQSGVLISWPTKTTDWRHNLAAAETTYLELATQISQYSHSYICCKDSDTRQRVQKLCRDTNIPGERYTLFTIPYDDTWSRDYGPLCLRRDTDIVWLNFEFNAWGGKYAFQQDRQLTQRLHQHLHQSFSNKRILENIDFVLEGGSIDSDGKGTILTTSQCLLDPARNPGLSKQQIGDKLKKSLGIHRVLWLDHGYLQGDDTDAHIDTLARFCNVETIAYVQCTNPADPHFNALSAMERQLQTFTQINGQAYRLIPLPLADSCINNEGQPLPASYANFLIINGAILVPGYGLDSDGLALTQLQKAFTGYDIIPIQCRSLVEQFGSLHCITMQIL
jgi:agmatine/peptidylarginine deiminase